MKENIFKCYLIYGKLNDLNKTDFIKVGITKNSIKSRISDLKELRAAGKFIIHNSIKEYGYLKFKKEGECKALEALLLDELRTKLERPEFYSLQSESFITNDCENILKLMFKICKEHNLNYFLN